MTTNVTTVTSCYSGPKSNENPLIAQMKRWSLYVITFDIFFFAMTELDLYYTDKIYRSTNYLTSVIADLEDCILYSFQCNCCYIKTCLFLVATFIGAALFFTLSTAIAVVSRLAYFQLLFSTALLYSLLFLLQLRLYQDLFISRLSFSSLDLDFFPSARNFRCFSLKNKKLGYANKAFFSYSFFLCFSFFHSFFLLFLIFLLFLLKFTVGRYGTGSEHCAVFPH